MTETDQKPNLLDGGRLSIVMEEAHADGLGRVSHALC